MNAAETRKLAASIASASAGLPAATMSAPTAGPAMFRMLRDSCSSAFASWSVSSAATSRTSPVVAGPENAPAVPKITWSATTVRRSALPEKKSNAVSPWVSAFKRSVLTRIVRRRIRSAKTPPSRTKMIVGTSRARSTMPRSVTPPMSSTANARATVDMPLPSVETLEPIRYRVKLPSRRSSGTWIRRTGRSLCRSGVMEAQRRLSNLFGPGRSKAEQENAGQDKGIADTCGRCPHQPAKIVLVRAPSRATPRCMGRGRRPTRWALSPDGCPGKVGHSETGHDQDTRARRWACPRRHRGAQAIPVCPTSR